MQRIYFEDKGQDFLWWELDEENKVVDCGPFQFRFWVGHEVHPSTIKIGECPITRYEGEVGKLKYAITKIEKESEEGEDAS